MNEAAKKGSGGVVPEKLGTKQYSGTAGRSGAPDKNIT
jgi:hypothetical protein